MQASAFKPDLLMTAVFKNIVAVRLDFIVGLIVTMAVIAARAPAHPSTGVDGSKVKSMKVSKPLFEAKRFRFISSSCTRRLWRRVHRFCGGRLLPGCIRLHDRETVSRRRDNRVLHTPGSRSAYGG
jgi:hypothetical protein